MSAERNLLFGILALQMDFISRDALIGAMNSWVLDKARPLGQILVDQGALRGDANLLLEALVQKHVEMHDCDPEKSLAAVSALGSARDDLQQIADSDLNASLAHLPDPYATRASLVGKPTPTTGRRFRILRPHAKGGLGEVFVACDEELGREVALKEIQSQYADDPACRSRFLLEAEITGCLEHPGIVPVYALGTSLDGRPYYTMRFIRGDNLNEAIRHFHEAEKPGREPGERALELRQLLGRFVDVCNAISYAHSRGVLHRDLKPGNVMLGQYGETLVVDWGLAKPVGRAEGTKDSLEKTFQPTCASGSAPTRMGSALGTPQFMPPEQAAGLLDQMGPASDVYSLGATLYALLTGKAPVQGSEVGTILQKVQCGDFSPPRQIKASVPRALEAVCLKAMALKPEDRYASARGLADEIEHWLAGEPVAAYREPWTARASRWVRRHRTTVTAAVAAVAVAAICLAAATVLLTAANRREREAKEEVVKEMERADRNFASARKAVEDYCTNVTEDRQLKHAGFHELRKKLLQTAVSFYQDFVAQRRDDPELQADRGRAFDRLALLRSEMGETAEAIADYEQVQAIFAELERSHPDSAENRKFLASSFTNRGVLLNARNQLQKAESAYRQALVIQEKLVHDFPAEPDYRRALAVNHSNLGLLLSDRGQLQEAEASYRQALAIQEKLTQDYPAVPRYRLELAASHHNLGILLIARGRQKEAEASFRQAVAIQENLVREFPAVPEYRKDLAKSHEGLSVLLHSRGQQQEAEAGFRQAAAIQEKLVREFPAVPEYRQDLATSHNSLGVVLKAKGQHQEAETACRHAIDIQEKLAQDFPAVPEYRKELAQSGLNLGNLLRARGQHQEAEMAYRQALTIQEKLAQDFPAVPDYRLDLAKSHHNLGMLLHARGRRKEAEAAYRQGLDVQEKLAQDFPKVPEFRENLGRSCYQVACVCAMTAAVEKDAGLVEQGAVRAIELLAKARDAGYFKDGAKIEHLKKDANLNSLRSRDDFKKLLADLEAR